jgi:hypothetical protein
MTTRKRTRNAPAPKVEETPAAVEEVVAEAPVTEETPAQEEIAEEAPVEATEPVLKDKDPVIGELKEEVTLYKPSSAARSFANTYLCPNGGKLCHIPLGVLFQYLSIV